MLRTAHDTQTLDAIEFGFFAVDNHRKSMTRSEHERNIPSPERSSDIDEAAREAIEQAVSYAYSGSFDLLQRFLDRKNEEGINLSQLEEMKRELRGVSIDKMKNSSGIEIADQLIEFCEGNGIHIELTSQDIQSPLEGEFQIGGGEPELYAAFAEKRGVVLDYQHAFGAALSEGRADYANRLTEFLEQHSKEASVDYTELRQSSQTGLEVAIGQAWIDGADDLIKFSALHGAELEMNTEGVRRACQNGIRTILTSDSIQDDEWNHLVGDVQSFCESHGITVDFGPAFQASAEQCIREGNLWQAQKIAEHAEKNGCVISFTGQEMAISFQQGLSKRILSGITGLQDVEEYARFAQDNNIQLDFQTADVRSAYQKAMEKILSDTASDVRDQMFRKTHSQELLRFMESHAIDADLAPSYLAALQHFLVHPNYGDPKVLLDLARERGVQADFAPAFQQAAEEDLTKYMLYRDATSVEYIIEKANECEVQVNFRPPLERAIQYVLGKGNAPRAKAIIEVAKKYNIKVDVPTM